MVTDVWSGPSTGAARTDSFRSKGMFDECIAMRAQLTVEMARTLQIFSYPEPSSDPTYAGLKQHP
jgi:hypothetical protein